MARGSPLNVKELVSPTQIAQSLEHDFNDEKYIADIEASRKQMIDGDTVEWHAVADSK